MEMEMELEKQRAFESFIGYLNYIMPDPGRGSDSTYDHDSEMLGLRFNEMQPARDFLKMANSYRSNTLNFLEVIERISFHMRMIDKVRHNGHANFENIYFESLFDHVNDLASYMRGELCSILSDKAYPESFKEFCRDLYEMTIERAALVFMWSGVNDMQLAKFVSNKNITGTFPHSFIRKLSMKDFMKKHAYYEVYKEVKKPLEMSIEDALVNGTLLKIEKKKVRDRVGSYINSSTKEAFGRFNVPRRLIQSKLSKNYGLIPQIDLLQIRAGRYSHYMPKYTTESHESPISLPSKENSREIHARDVAPVDEATDHKNNVIAPLFLSRLESFIEAGLNLSQQQLDECKDSIFGVPVIAGFGDSEKIMWQHGIQASYSQSQFQIRLDRSIDIKSKLASYLVPQQLLKLIASHSNATNFADLQGAEDTPHESSTNEVRRLERSLDNAFNESLAAWISSGKTPNFGSMTVKEFMNIGRFVQGRGEFKRSYENERKFFMSKIGKMKIDNLTAAYFADALFAQQGVRSGSHHDLAVKDIENVYGDKIIKLAQDCDDFLNRAQEFPYNIPVKRVIRTGAKILVPAIVIASNWFGDNPNFDRNIPFGDEINGAWDAVYMPARDVVVNGIELISPLDR